MNRGISTVHTHNTSNIVHFALAPSPEFKPESVPTKPLLTISESRDGQIHIDYAFSLTLTERVQALMSTRVAVHHAMEIEKTAMAEVFASARRKYPHLTGHSVRGHTLRSFLWFVLGLSLGAMALIALDLSTLWFNIHDYIPWFPILRLE